MLRKYVAVLLFMLLFLSAIPTSAQMDFNDKDLANIDYVAQAYQNLFALDSYSIVSETMITQALTQGTLDGTLLTSLNMMISSAESVNRENGEVLAYQMISEQEVEILIPGGGGFVWTLTLENIISDDSYYARATDITGTPFIGVPNGWIDLTTTSLAFEPGVGVFNPQGYGTLFLSQWHYIPTDDVLIEITETPQPDSTVRVFNLSYDPQALLNNGDLERSAETIYDFDTLVTSVEVGYMDGLIDDYIANTTLDLIVTIDTEDNIVISSTGIMITQAPFSFGALITGQFMNQSVSATFEYGDFNENMDIPVPDQSNF